MAVTPRTARVTTPDMPRWARQMAQAIAAPPIPQQAAIYATAAALPSAVKYRGCFAYLDSIPMMIFSDGTSWRRTDTGWTV